MARASVYFMWCFTFLTSVPIYGISRDVTDPDTSPADVTGLPVRPEWWSCGDNRCLCSGRKADCSGHQGQMTYVPKLPENITNVDLSRNNFTSDALTVDFFANLTGVGYLDLSHNNISWLSRAALESMTKLGGLSLTGNRALRPASLSEVLSIQSLRTISAENCNLPPPATDLFENSTSSVYKIRLDSNPHGGTYNLQGFCPLRHLHQLYLLDCDFKEITSSCSLQSLSALDLSGNTLREFPKTCLGKGISMFPALMFLALSHNRIEEISTAEVCLPSLMHLDMSYNFIKSYPTGTFSSLKFPQLEKLRLHHQSSYWDIFVVGTQIQDYAFNNPNLKELDLSHNELEVADLRLTGKHAFANCHNLRELYLDSNNFTHMDDRRFLELFGHMKLLTTLQIANSQFEQLSTKMFTNFPNLVMLFLHDNIINDIPDGAFDSLQRLEMLLLHNNKIKTISEGTFGPQLRQGLSTLTLGVNPFVCSCQLLWFRQWLAVQQPELFQGRYVVLNDYKCHNLPGVGLANFTMAEQACLLSAGVSLVIVQSCSILLLSFTLVALLFRYRWHLRLLMYEVFRGRDGVRKQRLQANNFDYDVFVSYASEDLPWVREQLMNKLEGELGLRLCVHERDFVLGQHIVDNIVQCVDGSKKILMVFSQHFMRSQWCQFELSLCLSHVMDHDDALIVVCVDDVTSRQMTSAMMAVLKTTTYIQWQEEDEDAVVSFWGRVHLALNEILPHGEHYV